MLQEREKWIMKKGKTNRTSENIVAFILIIIVLLLPIAGVIFRSIQSSKSEWECKNIIDYDQDLNNDYKCENKDTGKTVYVSKEEADDLIYDK